MFQAVPRLGLVRLGRALTSTAFVSSPKEPLRFASLASARRLIQFNGGGCVTIFARSYFKPHGIVVGKGKHFYCIPQRSGSFTLRKVVFFLMDLDQGRVISDAFVYRLDETDYLVDCHYQLLDQIIRHCQKYRLRMKVDIGDVSDKFEVWAAWGDFAQLDLLQKCVVRCDDSRETRFWPKARPYESKWGCPAPPVL